MKQRFLLGMRAALPLSLGIVPVAFSFSVISMEAGLSIFETVLMSLLVMAGSSQIMAIGMLSQGAAAPAIVLATFFINLRHIVMSSSVMRRLGKLSLIQKLAGAYALCDESFALFSLTEDGDYPFLLGANTALSSLWIIGTAVGCMLNFFLPPMVSDSLGIAFYAAFLAMLVPAVKGSLHLLILVLFTAAVNWGLQQFMDPSWSVIISMVGCAALGACILPSGREEGKHEN